MSYMFFISTVNLSLNGAIGHNYTVIFIVSKFMVSQIIDQSGDAILGCSTDRPIRCRVSFDIKTWKNFFSIHRMIL